MAELPDSLKAREGRKWTVGEMLEKGDVSTGISRDVKERFECYAIALQHGFLTVAEVRKLENLPALSGNEKGKA